MCAPCAHAGTACHSLVGARSSPRQASTHSASSTENSARRGTRSPVSLPRHPDRNSHLTHLQVNGQVHMVLALRPQDVGVAGQHGGVGVGAENNFFVCVCGLVVLHRTPGTRRLIKGRGINPEVEGGGPHRIPHRVPASFTDHALVRVPGVWRHHQKGRASVWAGTGTAASRRAAAAALATKPPPAPLSKSVTPTTTHTQPKLQAHSYSCSAAAGYDCVDCGRHFDSVSVKVRRVVLVFFIMRACVWGGGWVWGGGLHRAPHPLSPPLTQKHNSPTTRA